MLSGVEFAAVRDAIARAFGPDEFDMFLYERLDFNRQATIADGPFKVVVFNVLKAAEQQGWEAALIAEVAAARPLKKDVQDVYEKYARALVDDARRQVIDVEKLKAVERFGLGPSVTLLKGGVAQLPYPMKVGDSGLERQVRQDLPYLDLGLWREQIFRLEGLVCRVEINGAPAGTGFLVGPDSLLTNYHVLEDLLEDRIAPQVVKLRFDFRVLPTGLRSQGTLVQLHETAWRISASKMTAGEAANNPDATLPTADELDYALVRLNRPFGKEPYQPGSSKRGWIEVPSAAPVIEPNTPILIIQCPKGSPLMMALDTAGLQGVNANGTRVRYKTNTEEGSSGSPCFDIHFGLIALHHYGDVAHDKAQFNQGVLISAIRDRLKREGAEAAVGGQP
jgi:Trypsin-like peptidase domain/Effector-associated domain 1